MRVRLFAGLLVVGIAASACSSSSDANCSGGGNLTVEVTDSINNDMPICDATVTVTPSGGMPQTLAVSGPKTACKYTTQLPQGTYVVAASKAMYTGTSTNLRIGSDGCKTDSPSVTLGLLQIP